MVIARYGLERENEIRTKNKGLKYIPMAVSHDSGVNLPLHSGVEYLQLLPDSFECDKQHQKIKWFCTERAGRMEDDNPRTRPKWHSSDILELG